MRKIKNMLLYGGLDQETYNNIRPLINEENRKSVSVFTIIGTASFLFAAMSSFTHNPGVNASIYFIGAGIFILMHILNILCHKQYPIVSDALAIIFSVALIFSGILIAYSQINDRTTMLLPLFTLVSLVFCYRPVYLLSILVVLEAVYLVLMNKFQAPDLFFVNMVNTCIFCLIGLIGGFYTLSFKHKKYQVEYENKLLVERDALTGVYNRHSIHNELLIVQNEKKTVSICTFDVNGLKKVNDSLGHLAGDELIKGAAECISDVFGEYGRVYRIGGDEFCVLAYKEFDKDQVCTKFQERLKSWKGELNTGISIAVGIATLDFDHNANLHDAIHEADIQMYASKREYYRVNEC